MQIRFIAVAAATATASAVATADTFILPHLLEVRGGSRITNTQFTFDTMISAPAQITSNGPDPTGHSSYSYGGPLHFDFTDAGGNAHSVQFHILDGQTVPDAGGFRTTLTVQPVWHSLNGQVMDAVDRNFILVVSGFEPDPIRSSNPPLVSFPTPAINFAATDGAGRDIFLDLDPGTLTIPVPASPLLLALGGAFLLRRRRAQHD